MKVCVCRYVCRGVGAASCCLPAVVRASCVSTLGLPPTTLRWPESAKGCCRLFLFMFCTHRCVYFQRDGGDVGNCRVRCDTFSLRCAGAAALVGIQALGFGGPQQYHNSTSVSRAGRPSSSSSPAMHRHRISPADCFRIDCCRPGCIVGCLVYSAVMAISTPRPLRALFSFLFV